MDEKNQLIELMKLIKKKNFESKFDEGIDY